jgi:hypothetical protein
MNNKKIYVSLSLSLEDVDVVLNALEEKALSIQSLRQSIYDVANNQVQIIKTQEEKQKQTLNKNKRGK